MTTTIEHLDPGSLRPWATNARTHSKKQLRQIAKSIETFGFTNPVLIDQHGTILAGHGRVEAAKSLGMAAVPCLRIEHMSEAEKRAYVIADNKLALNAGWDEQLLAQELQGLLATETLGFDIGVIGFEVAEIDSLIEALNPEEPGNPEDDVIPEIAPRRVHPGDIWQLGNHRLICGDALDPKVLDDVMQGELARMVFADPPYNVKIDGHVGGSGKTRHREFAMASGEMTDAEFTTFLTRALRNMADHSLDGSIHFQCMDWRHMQEMLAAGHAVYDELKNLIVWTKTNAGMGTFYRSQHELIFAWKVGTTPHINNFGLGETGRWRSNVWTYAGCNAFKRGRDAELAMHSTVKPLSLVSDAIRDCSKRGGLILDPFGGSGITLIAAEKTGRRARLIEIDPLYCDVIVRRWQAETGRQAVLEATGETFDAVAANGAAAVVEGA
jgi:DNA modification methylase